MRTMNIPIFIPHYGCPNGCVFCNQRKISGKESLDDDQSIRDIIESSLKTSGNRQHIEIAFFGGSFTGLEKYIQKKYLEIASEYVNNYNLEGIRISTRPDYINKDVMDFLSNYPITAIELGVQSLDEEVLIKTKRNHTLKDVETAVKLIKSRSISLGLQMMIGLPGDTLIKTIESAHKIIEFKPNTLRIYPTLVLPDTELNDMYRAGDYNPITLEDAVDWVSKILPLFNETNIQILRVGLQSNEGLSGDLVIAGPYHPAFKELVLDKMVYDELSSQIIWYWENNQNGNLKDLKLHEDQYDLEYVTDGNHLEKINISINTNQIKIKASPAMKQRIVGHKKQNMNRFIDLFERLLHRQVKLNISE